ncbi:MAG: glycosyltransferase family 4 protein [Aestuariivirga sp.]
MRDDAAKAGGPGGAGLPPQRIAVVASLTRSLTNFRYQLLKAMTDAGHQVTAFAPEDDRETIEKLREIGVQFVRIPMARTGLNPIADLRTLFALYRGFRASRPTLVLPYTMKPIIYGCLAARLAGVERRFALFTGMGHIFADPHPKWRGALVRAVSVALYRRALKGVRGVFVYNDADDEDIRKHRMLADNSIITGVAGSGVDLDHYPRSGPDSGEIKFLLIARLLRDKGIFEYAEAARQLRAKHPKVRFQLLGPLEPHSSSVSHADLAAMAAIEYLGETNDVRPFLAACSVFVLPSYYREGIPRSILEALATGRAVITTDAPGCRETVIEGKNGFLIPARDSGALAAAMERFIRQPRLIDEMGVRSYELAVAKFDVHAVNRALLATMGLGP